MLFPQSCRPLQIVDLRMIGCHTHISSSLAADLSMCGHDHLKAALTLPVLDCSGNRKDSVLGDPPSSSVSVMRHLQIASALKARHGSRESDPASQNGNVAVSASPVMAPENFSSDDHGEAKPAAQQRNWSHTTLALRWGWRACVASGGVNWPLN